MQALHEVDRGVCGVALPQVANASSACDIVEAIALRALEHRIHPSVQRPTASQSPEKNSTTSLIGSLPTTSSRICRAHQLMLTASEIFPMPLAMAFTCG
jgi:hypothetical protein